MTHQGFIGSLGTSALLVASAVAIMAVASAILAFEGWPGPSADAPTRTFVIEAGSAGGTQARPGPDVVLDPPPRTRRAGPSSAADAGSAIASGAGAVDVAGEASAEGAVGAGNRGTPSDPAPAPGAGGTGSTLPEAGSEGGPGATVDDATGAIDDAAGGAVDGVAPLTDRVAPLTDGVGAGESLTDGLGRP